MSGIQDIERSIEIALAANSAECVRGYTNLSATLLASVGDIERGIEADAEGIRAAERFGDEIGLRFLRGHQMLSGLITGRWDESLAIADDFIAAGEAGSPHYMIDQQGVRLAGLNNRVPNAVLSLELLGAAVAMGLLALYLSVIGRGLVPVITAAILVSLLVLITFDLDRPTRGLITVPATPPRRRR